MIRLTATKEFHPEALDSVWESDPLSSRSLSPREYAVPRVDTTTSLAAKPPTRAIFVRQSKPASFVIPSSAVPNRPAIEFFKAASASCELIIESCFFNSKASGENFGFSPAAST